MRFVDVVELRGRSPEHFKQRKSISTALEGMLLLLLQQVSEDSSAQQDMTTAFAVRFDQGFARLLAQFPLELAFRIKFYRRS